MPLLLTSLRRSPRKPVAVLKSNSASPKVLIASPIKRLGEATCLESERRHAALLSPSPEIDKVFAEIPRRALNGAVFVLTESVYHARTLRGDAHDRN
jgi:hypothetical protein